MYFVIVTKNEKAVPSDQKLREAMTASSGDVHKIEPADGGKKVIYTGDVAHSVFVSNLRKVADGKATSWNFAWGDMEGAPAGAAGEMDGYAAAAHNGHRGLSATQYEVDITMSADTVTALNSGNYNLYGFKAVQVTQGGGAPLVWFQLPPNSYSKKTQLTWSVQYQAYVSTSQIIPGGQVTASDTADIDLGQTAMVVEGPIIDSVAAGGPQQAISIYNSTKTKFTCGISQSAVDGSENPMCAFPLYGQGLDAIAPIEKILLMFSTTPVNTGTVVEQAYSSCIMIDLTAQNTRAVSFDINAGWDWGGLNWGAQYPPNTELVPLLIEQATTVPGAVIEPRALVLA